MELNKTTQKSQGRNAVKIPWIHLLIFELSIRKYIYYVAHT